MIIDEAAKSARFIEIKTGKAIWTRSQNKVYPQIKNGTALLTKNQAARLGLDPRTTQTVRDAFPGGYTVETIRGPGYLE